MSDRDFNRGRRGWNREDERSYERGGRSDYGREPYSMDDRYKSNRQSTDWMTPGPYTGVGPKGYRRKDERILDEINERLTRHGQVDASNISVGVSEGLVTLNGMVSSRREKHIAEYVAESVSGVEDVHNNLRVVSGEGQRREWKAPGEATSDWERGWSREEPGRGSEQAPGSTSEKRNEARSGERDLSSSSIPNTGALDISSSGPTTGGEHMRGARTYGTLGVTESFTGGQALGGMTEGDVRAGGTPSQSGPTGGTMPSDVELEKPDFLHETETQSDTPESEVPAEMRGEGMTPQSQMPGEASLPAYPAAQFEGIRHEAPEMGAETAQQPRAEMDEEEPDPTQGPSAVASGPTDIASGVSGSTWGDQEETHEEQIPQTGGAFKGGAFGDPIDTGIQDQPDLTIPGQTDFTSLIQPGMVVIGKDDQQVGTVKEVRYDDFLLDRPMARDIYVPFRACDRIDNAQVMLTVDSDAITQQGWETPSIF